MAELTIIYDKGEVHLEPSPKTVPDLLKAARILGAVMGRIGEQIRLRSGVPKDDTLQARLRECADHDTSGHCWLQDDGSHIGKRRCACGVLGSYNHRCPIDFHRRQAAKDEEAARQSATPPRMMGQSAVWPTPTCSVCRLPLQESGCTPAASKDERNVCRTPIEKQPPFRYPASGPDGVMNHMETP